MRNGACRGSAPRVAGRHRWRRSETARRRCGSRRSRSEASAACLRPLGRLEEDGDPAKVERAESAERRHRRPWRDAARTPEMTDLECDPSPLRALSREVRRTQVRNARPEIPVTGAAARLYEEPGACDRLSVCAEAFALRPPRGYDARARRRSRARDAHAGDQRPNEQSERELQRPVKRGWRFSRKAATPSLKSSVLVAALCSSASSASCSSSVAFTAPSKSRFVIPMPAVGPAA